MLCLRKEDKHAVFGHVLKLLCWDVCRRCRGCRFEDAHAVGGGFSAGVSAEEVEWGTEGGECFHTVTHRILLEKLSLGCQSRFIVDPR